MTKPTPEQIINAMWPGVRHGSINHRGRDTIKALTDAGKIIVDREALKNLLQAQIRSDKLTDQIIDELTTDTGS